MFVYKKNLINEGDSLRKTPFLNARKSALGVCFLVSFLCSTTSLAQIDNAERSYLAERFVGLLGPKLEKLQKERLEEYYKENPFSRVPDNEELLFSLQKGSILFDGSLSIIKNQEGVYLALSDLLFALDFPITVDFKEKKAQGWYIRENRDFLLDLENKEIIANGLKITLSDNDFILDEDFELIFLRKEIIETAFDFSFSFRIDVLEASFTSKQPLPIEEQIYRQQRRDNLIFTKKEAVLPEIKQEYSLISQPVVDFQMQNRYSKRPFVDQEEVSGNYSVVTANDLLYGGVKTFIAGDDTQKVETLRFTWTKETEADDDFGFAGINKIQFGDVVPSQLDLLSGSGQEFGIKVSNDSVLGDSATDQVDTTRFEGDIQPGWDVEVYRNNILLTTQTATGDGRYVIEDVPLNFGENEFRLVFYGPQGQIEEREEVIVRQDNLYSLREPKFAFSITNQNEITYRADQRNVNTPNSGTPNFIGNVGIGLSEDYSLKLGARLFEKEKEQLGQLSASATGYFDKMIVTGTVAGESTGGYGVSSSVLANVAKQSVSLRGRWNTDDFETTKGTEDSKLIIDTSARVSGAINPWSSYSVDAQYRQLANNDHFIDLGGDVSQRWGRATYGLGYDYNFINISGNKDEAASVNLNARMPYGRNYFRTAMNYNLLPEQEIRSYLFAVNRAFNEKLTGQLEVDHSPITNETTGQVRLNYRNDYFTWSPNIRVTSEDEIIAVSTLRFGLGADPYSDQFKVSSQRLTSAGGVSARVFFDENGNGVWDYFERPIQNAEIVGEQINKSGITNEKGVAFIPTLNEGRLTDVTLEQSSLEDPYFVSLNEGNSVRFRAGQVTQMDFPVAISGEIDGTISFFDDRGRLRPFRNINVFLVDMDGKIRSTGQTAYDGFYVVSNVMPGEYKLILDPIAVEQSQFVQIQPKGYKFKPNGTVFFDQNFVTFRKDIPREVLSEIMGNQSNDRRVVLELGRYNSKLLLAVKWIKYKNQFSELFGGLEMYEGLVQNDLNQADNKYPLHIGPIDSFENATMICDELDKYGVPCDLRSISTDPEAKDRKV